MISIITSLYRSDKHIEAFSQKAISVGEQLMKHGISFEHIIIANDPTPKEIAVSNSLKKYPWVSWHSVGRETLYATWNRGVGLAKGQACTFWNVDDVRFAEGFIDAELLVSQGAHVVYPPFKYKRYVWFGPFKILVKRKVFRQPDFNRADFIKAMYNGPFFTFTKKVFDAVGPFDESYKVSGDFDWCSRAAEKFDFTKSNVIAGIFTNDGTTLSGQKSPTHRLENERINTRVTKILTSSKDTQ